MHKLRRTQNYILVFLVVGIFIYWLVRWYLPLPPITSEKEAIAAVVYYFPETKKYLETHEIKVHDSGAHWIVGIELSPTRLPPYIAFEVNKATGFVKPIPLR